MDGGSFQALAQRYCLLKYGLQAPSYLGTAPGSTKPAKGQPDSFYLAEDGSWIFMESGHYLDRAKAVKKIQDDVGACLAYEDRHPELVISRIICCHACGRLQPHDKDEIARQDDRVVLVGPDQIAEDCSTKYPSLAKDYLGVMPSSGQFHDAASFLEKVESDKFAPSLKNRLVGREVDFDRLKKLVKKSRAVCVSGRSGSGKTKLAFEVCQHVAKEDGADFYIVQAGRRSVYEEATAGLGASRKSILLVDDANDVADLKDLMEYVATQEGICLVATVREYVRQGVREVLRRMPAYEEFVLSPLDNSTIREVLENQYGVENARHREQITKVAHGNLRLAILAADGLKRKGIQGIANIKELLEAAYSEWLKSFTSAESKSIAIASVLGPHIVAGNHNLELLEEKLSLKHEEYMDACRLLHDQELLDMIQGFSAVSFEEQNLRDYFIYKAFVQDALVDLSTIWPLARGHDLAVNCANVAMRVFVSKETYDVLVSQCRALWRSSDDGERIDVCAAFGRMIPAESLTFIAEQIGKFQGASSVDSYDVAELLKHKSHIRYSSKLLELLVPFFEDQAHWRYAFELLLDLIDGWRGYSDDYAFLLSERLAFSPFSFRCSFEREKYIMEKLFDRFELNHDRDYAALFVLYAKTLLNDEISRAYAGEGNEIILSCGYLPDEPSVIDLRKELIARLSCLKRRGYCSDLLDSIVLGYVGHVGDGLGVLAKETCAAITGEYLRDYACDSYEALRLLWCFRRHNASHLPDDRVFAKFFNTAESSFVVAAWETAYALKAGKQHFELIDECLLNMERKNWEIFERLLKTTRRKGQTLKDLYPVERAVLHAMEKANEERSELGRFLAKLYIRCEMNSFSAGKIVFPLLMEGHTVLEVRDELIETLPVDNLPGWLARFDEWAYGNSLEHDRLPDLALDGMSMYRELIEVGTVLKVDERDEGYFARYVSRLVQVFEGEHFVVGHYAVFINGAMAELLEERLKVSANLKAAEELLLASIGGTDDWLGAHLLKAVLAHDPDFLGRFFSEWVKRFAGMFDVPDFGDVFWALDDPCMSLSRIAQEAESLLDGYDEGHAITRAFASVVSKGAATACKNEVLEWLAKEVARAGSLSKVAADVGSTLDNAERSDLCVMICEKEVPLDLFQRVTASVSFNGESWSGRESAHIGRKIEWYRELQERLERGLHIKYARSVSEQIAALEHMKDKVELSEFVDPFWRGGQ